MGGNNFYYFNTNDLSGDEVEMERDDFKTEQEYEEYCESCAI